MNQEYKNEPSNNLELPKKDAESVAISVNLLLNNAKLFGKKHPSTGQAADDLCKKVSTMAAECGSPMITFMRSGKSFYVEKWIVDNRINRIRFTQDFDKLHIESISFTKDVLPWNITSFAECFLDALETHADADKIQADLKERGQKGVVINYVTLQKITKDNKIINANEYAVKGKDEIISPSVRSPINVISHLEKLFDVKNALEDKKFVKPAPDYNYINNELTLIKNIIGENSNSSDIDYDLLFNSLVDVSKVVKSADYLLNAQEKKNVISQIDNMTIAATLEIIKNEIKQDKFSTEKLVDLIMRLEPSKEYLREMLPQIKTAMLEAGFNVSDYLNFVIELGNKSGEENAADKIFDTANDYGIKSSEIIEAFSQNPDESVKLLLQSAEIRKYSVAKPDLSDYLSKMLDDIIRDAAIKKIKTKKIDGNVHSVLSSVISTVGNGLLTKLKENGLADGEADKIHKELTEKFPKTLEHLKNEWFINALANSEELSSDAIVKALTKVVGFEENIENYKDLIMRYAEKLDLSQKDLTDIFELARSQKEALEKKKDLPLLPPKTTIHFIKRYIAEFKRHKNPFSIVVISNKRQNRQDILTLSESIAYLVSKGFRFLDISGFVNIKGKDIAVIILPMTGSDGLQTVLKKISKQLDKDTHIITSITLENPDVDEYDYESVIKKLLREHV